MEKLEGEIGQPGQRARVKSTRHFFNVFVGESPELNSKGASGFMHVTYGVQGLA